MVGSFIVKTTREQSRVATVGIHSPDSRRGARFGATENNVLAVGRLAGPKVPDWPIGLREPRDGAIQVELADFCAALRELRDQLQAEFRLPLPRLSMGMSGDFAVAIEEGATLVRVGTAIFGARSGKAWKPE